jgi:hypothetical protein
MKHLKSMNWKRLVTGAWLCLLVLGLTGEDCTPDRYVEVVISVDMVAEFHAQGTDNTYSGSYTLDIGDEIDVEQIIEDNGLESIDSLTVQSAFVRTTQKDPAADRTVSGSVDIRQGSGPDSPVITYSSAAVNSAEYEDWVAVPLQAAGVGVINEALEDLLAGSGAVVTFTTSGTSTPVDTPTDFIWEVKLHINVVGTKKITIFEPL